MPAANPTATVITVAFNAVRTIERTINSVLSQTYAPLEYVIVDGGSNDGTVDVISRYAHRISKWVSEPDRGIADAFNKGVLLSTGAYIMFVNADDWIEPHHVARSVDLLEANPQAAFVYGDLLHYSNGRPAFLCKGSHNYRRSFGYRMGKLNHPTMVCRRGLFSTVGAFDTSFRIAMDFDWLQRLHKLGYWGLYTSSIRGNMELDGDSIRNAPAALRENRRAAINAGKNPAACWLIYLAYASRLLVRRGLERWLPREQVWRLRQFLLSSLEVVGEGKRHQEER